MVREPAWRVFAAEYNSSKHYIKADEPKKPSYVITPLGAKISRLFVVGVLTEVRPITDEVMKAKVVDQTGAFYLFVGKYSPQARQILDSVKVPQFVAVVGKANVYRPSEDQMYVSVVPERIKIVNEVLRDYWVFDTARKLKIRIEAMQEALEMSEPTVHKLVELGFSRKISEGVVEAIKRYDEIDVKKYMDILKNALKHLLPEYQELGYELPKIEEEYEEEEEYAGDIEIEDRILAAIEELDDGSGVVYEELVEKLSDIPPARIDEVIDDLLTRGELYEPTVGKLKRMKLP